VSVIRDDCRPAFTPLITGYRLLITFNSGGTGINRAWKAAQADL
jgi:hypothetical protein